MPHTVVAIVAQVSDSLPSPSSTVVLRWIWHAWSIAADWISARIEASSVAEIGFIGHPHFPSGQFRAIPGRGSLPCPPDLYAWCESRVPVVGPGMSWLA